MIAWTPWSVPSFSCTIVLATTSMSTMQVATLLQEGSSNRCSPPTREAPRQHIRRTAYQAGYCWGQMMVVAAELPSPSEWGWMKSDTGWDVCWATLPEATKACRQLLRCGCKKGCRGHFSARHYTTEADSVLGTRTCSINALPQWQFRLMLIR